MDLERAETIKHLVETFEFGIGTTTKGRHLALTGFTYLAANVALGALGLKSSEICLKLLLTRFDIRVTTRSDLLLLDTEFGLEARQGLMTTVLIDGGDHVSSEVDDLLEVLRR